MLIATTEAISQRIEEILSFMEPYWDLVNSHMVNYFTENHWKQLVPKELRLEVHNEDEVYNCIDKLFWHRTDISRSKDFPSFSHLLFLTEQHRLENFSNILTNLNELHLFLGKQKLQQISIKEFMSVKKRHEVEIIGELVNDLIQKYLKDSNKLDDIIVIDAGDGKGYLSSRVALQYHYKVLGIDSNRANTENALKRNKKLQRYWNTLKTTGHQENRVEDKTMAINACPIKFENYKTIVKFMTPELDLTQLATSFFPTVLQVDLCLMGLHTCGNLAPTCLKVFHAQKPLKVLCNVGCCYHMLKEAYTDDEVFNNKYGMDLQSQGGFPMSQLLQNKRVSLGRNARMLAAQSVERTNTFKNLPNVSLFYRALLEILIYKTNTELRKSVQVGKIRKFADFKDYVKLCANKVKFIPATLELERIEEIERKYAHQRCYMDLFYLLRMSFAPVIESLILLDRLLYLKELKYENSFLISVFDAVISPRHFAIVAIKS